MYPLTVGALEEVALVGESVVAHPQRIVIGRARRNMKRNIFMVNLASGFM